MNGVGTPGLGAIRGDIEHHPQPRDPFAVDTGRAVDAIRAQWGDSYVLKVRSDGTWEAVRRQRPHVTLEAPTPDGLYQLLLADSRSW